MILRSGDALIQALLLLLVRRLLVTAVDWRCEPVLEDSRAESGFDHRAGGRFLVRWHKLTSKPRGISVYSTGENRLCSLNRLHGINLDDRQQWKEIIYPTFGYNKAVIDSYLSGVVYPKGQGVSPQTVDVRLGPCRLEGTSYYWVQWD